MIGKTVSHFKILEKLCEGGMGVVYKAEDLEPWRLSDCQSLMPTEVRAIKRPSGWSVPTSNAMVGSRQ